ncbi:UNVERIFIED_CONTAM: hypothetical protein PYX00_011452 [Menopon gallinae]|uniref:DNA-3-methyladenine glycosylase n=1 Tax=Menopon gallinae TaxID=328185 RepID=A0AAW2H7V6_9NEOP
MLVRASGSSVQTVRIVETEAYPGGDDRASHSYASRRTARNAAMYMQPGTAYVYCVYGGQQCMNVSSRGEGAAVLVRAAEPVHGVDVMVQRRCSGGARASIATRGVCNGPSKLCQALAITKEAFDRVDTVTSSELFFATDGHTVDAADVVVRGRVGVGGYGEYWGSLPMRFYVRGSAHVSVR